METKFALREEFLKKRASLSEEERCLKSKKIQEKLFLLPEFKGAKVVMFYVAFRGEVETKGMIKDALSLGKKVMVPFVREKDMVPSEIENYNELQTGTFGILEPKEEFRRKVKLEKIDLILVPGIVFDMEGYMLGYGKGYYDRFLNVIKPESIGLAFQLQLIARLPRSQYDTKVNKIITEDRIL